MLIDPRVTVRRDIYAWAVILPCGCVTKSVRYDPDDDYNDRSSIVAEEWREAGETVSLVAAGYVWEHWHSQCRHRNS